MLIFIVWILRPSLRTASLSRMPSCQLWRIAKLKAETSVSLHPSSTPDPRKYSSGLAMALRLLHIPSHSNLKLPPFLAWASPFRPCASHFVCGTRLKSCSTDTPSQCRRWRRVASQMAQPELIRSAMRLHKCYKRVCDYKIYQNIYHCKISCYISMMHLTLSKVVDCWYALGILRCKLEAGKHHHSHPFI